MNSTIIFILGIVFSVLILPVLELFSDIILSLSKWIISAFNIKTSTNNVKIHELQTAFEPNSTNAIGFEAPQYIDEDYYEDDDEPEEKCKQKVGY